MQRRNIIVTSALPYANGDIHLGHLVEFIQADIWTRFQRMRGNHCYHICASDAHGTPIMLKAREQGIKPETLVKQSRQRQLQDLQQFNIELDNFHSTHSPENKHYTQLIYKQLQQQGLIFSKTIKQAYDPSEQMFLPDRFVKGTCPQCQAPDQYGDNCEACGCTYSPLELINPVSAISNQTPIEKASEHLFFDLPKLHNWLKEWVNAGTMHSAIANKLDEWFQQGLKPWDISRDYPYFGFEIPDHPNKYFYVWLDAPIGYMSSFASFAQHHQLDFDDFWDKDTTSELYHFVGKDIVYFHALFWPAVLYGAGYRLPTRINTHGFVTINGQKMSKSRGTFIKAQDYAKHLNPEYLRYYFATKLTDAIDDIDLNLEDFQQKVNTDLVGKLVNIASRCSRFITKHFDGQLAAQQHDPEGLFKTICDKQATITQYYENYQYAAVTREVMQLADQVNQYISDKRPWHLVKESSDYLPQVQAICSLALNCFRNLVLYLAPILPKLADDAAAFLNLAQFSWQDAQLPVLDHMIQPYSNLLVRLKDNDLQTLTASSSQSSSTTSQADSQQTSADKQEQTNPITIDDFAKVDLRVARIMQAEPIEQADKLLKLQLDVGDDHPRQVFAGIKQHYSADSLIDQHVVYVANLKPRKMRFGTSEGMVLLAGHGKQLYLLRPDEGAQPGDEIQ